MTKHLLKVGARSSPLSQVQVKEVLAELQRFHPEVDFEVVSLKTKGDLDQLTSLRHLEKSNFFTKEIDDLLLSKEVRIAIHSAKDLPDPLPEGLKCIALTQGLDSSDSLVIQSHYSLETLPKGALIATSSERREEMVKALRPDFTFTDIRGTINERLGKLESGQVAGVVIAEAALIRLGLTELRRIKLPGETTLNQGRLAILALEEDQEMADLFDCLNSSFVNP